MVNFRSRFASQMQNPQAREAVCSVHIQYCRPGENAVAGLLARCCDETKSDSIFARLKNKKYVFEHQSRVSMQGVITRDSQSDPPPEQLIAQNRGQGAEPFTNKSVERDARMSQGRILAKVCDVPGEGGDDSELRFRDASQTAARTLSYTIGNRY
jgi:hypothetical protein